MLMQMWTRALLFLLAVSIAAWVVAFAHEKDIHPAHDLVAFFKKLSISGRVAFGTLFMAMWIFASVKPGDGAGNGSGGEGGTNNVQMVAHHGNGLLPLASQDVITGEVSRTGIEAERLVPGVVPQSVQEQTADLSDVAVITSTNTSHVLKTSDFERGFVMYHVGTDGQIDFSPPANAVVCTEWRGFGGTTDWMYLALADWAFRLGANDVRRFKVHQQGHVVAGVTNEVGAIATDNWFAPLKAAIGIAKDVNWELLPEGSRPSQFWHSITPDNRLLMTWQNVLLGRETNNPVSFQIELRPGGSFAYRYDLSRLSAETVTNILVGASFGGNEWTTNSLPTNVTSMMFYPLEEADIYNHDPDGDGLNTIDELFVYNTDPRNRDTDYDGLSDYDELFTHETDPLDPYSISTDYSDGFALKIGDLDPFSYPESSTNSVLEHIFYSGTTNGVFFYPQSSDNMAVLQVSVSGSGTGDLIIGDKVVPLIAPPAPQQSPQNAPGNVPRLMGTASPEHSSLLVQLAKGETHTLYIRGDELLEVSLDSADFAFGTLPTHDLRGRINFPNTVAETPCIHDFNARKKIVSLLANRDVHQLTAEWSSAIDSVTVSNIPPRSTSITGNFPARQTASISYTLSHPEYLFGQTTYQQTVRFCPRPPGPDPDEEDSAEDPEWYDSGDGDSSDGIANHEEHWCCYWGTCGEWCDCGCDCANDEDGEDIPDDTEDFGEECPVHHMPYGNCAHWHEDDYTNAVQNVQHLGGVLYIREPPHYEQIHLDVPTEHRNCCPCPDHWTNYVGIAYKSYRLRIIDANGADFTKTETSSDVNLAGVYPSSAVGDAKLAFSRNGEVYLDSAKTVLGVAIKGEGDVNLCNYNALDSSFGYPMTVCTNLSHASQMRLVTNVKLPNGKVHLELANATGQFTVWYYDNTRWEYRKLLDTATTPVKDLSMAYWKALMKRATNGESAELPIRITSSEPGAVSLVFRYWNVIDGRFVQDQAVQRITSIRPPLRLDISRDGSIDDGDSAAWFDRRPFYYWINEDTIKGDRIGQISDRSPNVNDWVVNGTFDLVNFFPVALDLSRFTDAWQNRVTYMIYPEYENTNSFNFCFADVPWNEAGKIQTTNVTTLAGHTLSAASLESLPRAGYQLHYYDTLTRFSDNSGLMICEAKSRYASMRIDIKAGDTILYTYSVPMATLPVKEMYSWYNFRSLSGENVGRETTIRSHLEEYTKSLIFLHGANVSTEDAEQWGDVIFKRMWLSGSRARFYNVDWRSDIGGDANYHENASNAFVVASQIVSAITNAIPGEKVVMAHSLGNMVVSSMIQDYGLHVSKYLMCNSAVPSEAYYPANDVSIRVPQLVHPQWEEYPTNSWASNWHKLFVDDISDDRRNLGWPGRFSDVAPYAVSFYSTGDEVLELNDDNDIYVWTGATSGYVQYSWHHQELWKGRAAANVLGGTTWSGWNIEENWLGIDKISVSEARHMQPEDFKTNTVFYCYPSSMNSTNISLLVRAAHLAQGIPALARPTGGTNLIHVLSRTNAYDLNLDESALSGDDEPPEVQGVERPNGWPTRTMWRDRWTHSDIKDVSYFFNFKFYEKVTEKGALQ